MQIRLGVPEHQRQVAAELYDHAFGSKFAAIVPDRARRVALIAEVLTLDRAFVAIECEDGADGGPLLGLAGFHGDGRAFTGGGGLADLLRHLGVLGAIRAAAGFAWFERTPEPDEVLMDGICVAPGARGRGVGTALLRAVIAHAHPRAVRLDVIDTNPRARALYEREGFMAVHTERYPLLEPLLGFAASTTLVRPADAPTSDAATGPRS